MAVVLSVPQQAYTPRTVTLTPTLSANRKEIRVSFTRVSWPAGPCLRLTYAYPGGAVAGSVTFDGGASLDRAGQALSHAGLRGSKGAFLPQGQYTVTAEVLQTITTAVTVQDA